MKIRTTLGASLVAAALVLGPITAATAASAPAAVQVAAVASAQAAPVNLWLFQKSRQKLIIEIFDKTNAFREATGAGPLKFNVTIAAISQKWSNQMGSVKAHMHNPDFVSGAPAGHDWAAENIAMSNEPNPSGKDFVDMWIGSPGHNANMAMLDADFIGIGVATKHGVTYATQNFFSYEDGRIPPRTYNHPRDYFAGRPALPARVGGNVVYIEPSDPTANYDKGTYTVPDSTGVIYLLNGKVKAGGTYRATNSRLSFTAKADDGYILINKSKWFLGFHSLAATPTAPTFNHAKRTYTIPDTARVTYVVNGAVKAPGTYPRSTKITITAKAAAPAFLEGKDTWSYDFRKVVTPAKPAMNSKTNKYTIPKKSGVTYFVEGRVKKPGTYTVADGKSLTFTAKNSSSSHRLTGTNTWNIRF